MKNVDGKDLPFNDVSGKQEWYDSHEATNEDVGDEGPSRFNLPGKDDYFWNIVIPFCREHGVKTILDVGANVGRYSIFFEESIPEVAVTATELTPARTNRLTHYLKLSGAHPQITPVIMDIEEAYSSQVGKFDLIYMSDVVEHFINWEATIAYNIVPNCKYCYMLIPGGKSWSWSQDHLHEFNEEDVTWLINMFPSLFEAKRIWYDEDNYWWAILTGGSLS